MNPNQPPGSGTPTVPQQPPQPYQPPSPQQSLPSILQVPQRQQVPAGQPPSQPLQSAPQQLADVVSSSQEILCKAKTVFPFVLFPDTIIVDREKVTINHTSFFKSGDTESTHIDDILNVTANVGPLFGSLRFTIRNVPPTTPHEIKYLRRTDVIRIKNILQGYIIARQNNVDTASMPRDQLVSMLQQLGGGRYTSTTA